jgi:hypothetical protein
VTTCLLFESSFDLYSPSLKLQDCDTLWRYVPHKRSPDSMAFRSCEHFCFSCWVQWFALRLRSIVAITSNFTMRGAKTRITPTSVRPSINIRHTITSLRPCCSSLGRIPTLCFTADEDQDFREFQGPLLTTRRCEELGAKSDSRKRTCAQPFFNIPKRFRPTSESRHPLLAYRASNRRSPSALPRTSAKDGTQRLHESVIGCGH